MAVGLGRGRRGWMERVENWDVNVSRRRSRKRLSSRKGAGLETTTPREMVPERGVRSGGDPLPDE